LKPSTPIQRLSEPTINNRNRNRAGMVRILHALDSIHNLREMRLSNFDAHLQAMKPGDLYFEVLLNMAKIIVPQRTEAGGIEAEPPQPCGLGRAIVITAVTVVCLIALGIIGSFYALMIDGPRMIWRKING
jgi:hypothetical protein